MKVSLQLCFLAFLFNYASEASLLCHPEPKAQPKPPAFFLAGDSTTAAQSCCGGGWGNGFLSTVQGGAIGTNFGHNGATTVSFLSDADWADVLESVKFYSPKYTPYVTIQFGHNDQKAAANISIEEYSANLKAFALNVTALGGQPILVTPLSRRNYNGSNLIIEDLHLQAVATISVAQSIRAMYIDLNRHSTDYLDAIGKYNATKYNLVPSDFTHLNPSGSLVFGNMVSQLIIQAVKSVRGNNVDAYLRPNSTILMAINSGKFVLPNAS